MNTNNIIIIECPHCNQSIIITKLNCSVFRHAVYKDTGKQVHSHMNKYKCEKLLRQNKIYGCGKPFRIDIIDEKYVPIICDYI